jgi:hypothetical protein
MNWPLSKFTDLDLAQALGSLNDGSDRMRTRLLCEISFRLTRAGRGPLTAEESEMAGNVMNYRFQQREQDRRDRRTAARGGRKPARALQLVR